MDPHRSKALAFFNNQGTTSILVAAHRPDWRPVVEAVWSDSDAAAILAIQLGGTQAALTLNQTGNDNTIIFKAWRKGDSGENITIEVVEAGTATPLSIATTVTDHLTSTVAIVINLATGAADTATSTAAEVIAAVNADPTASKYVYALASGAVTGVMTEDTAPTALTSATPDEDADIAFADAFTFAGVLPPGGLVGNPGDDVRVAVSAGTDNIFVTGYWIQGEDLGYGPLINQLGKFTPAGRPVGVAGV